MNARKTSQFVESMATRMAEGRCALDISGDHKPHEMWYCSQWKWYCSCSDRKGRIHTVLFAPSNILEHKSPGIVFLDPIAGITGIFMAQGLKMLTGRSDIHNMALVLNHKLSHYPLFSVFESQRIALLAAYKFPEHL